MTPMKVIPVEDGNSFCSVSDIFPNCLVNELSVFISNTENQLIECKAKECSSKIIYSAVNYAATALLIKGDREGYVEYQARIFSLKIPDYRPGLMDFFGMSPIRPKIGIVDYFSNLQGGRFRNQDTLANYLVKSLKHCTKEYQTKNGRCDLFINGKLPFLVELKIGTITRKDIHQCRDYIDGTDGKYPVVLIGHLFKDDLANFAEKSGVSIYTYRIKTLAPITVSLNKKVGESINALNGVGAVEYFPPYWDTIARQQGWVPKGEMI